MLQNSSVYDIIQKRKARYIILISENKTTNDKFQSLMDKSDTLSKLGIQIYDNDGQIRHVLDVLNDLKSIWHLLKPWEQSYVASIFVGLRKNRFIFESFMKNFEKEGIKGDKKG